MSSTLTKIRSRCLELMAESFALTNLKFYRQAVHTLRQHNEHLLQMVLLASGGKSWEDVEKMESFDLLTTAAPLLQNKKIETFFRTVSRYGNLSSHPNREQEFVLSASLVWTLFHMAGLCWLWCLHRILGEGQNAFIDILDAVTRFRNLSQDDLEKINKDMGRRRVDSPEEILLPSNPSRRFAVHSGTLEYLKHAEEQDASRLRLFLFFVYAWVSYDLEIPFVEKTVLKTAQITVIQFRLTGLYSALLLEMKGTQVLFHAGKELTLEQWQRASSLVTNSRDFLEILHTRTAALSEEGILPEAVITGSLDNSGLFKKLQLVLQDQSQHSLAPEIIQRAFGIITSDTYEDFQKECQGNSGFRQSNIKLIAQDKDLAEAFTFPMDSWRLFLHPTQLKIRESKSRFLMIKGGPGTGKTVILLHRVKYLLERRQRQVPDKFTILVLIFTDLLKTNIETMLEKLEVSPEVLTLVNYHEYCDLWSKGILSWRHQEGKPSVLIDKRLPQPERLCTDLVLDEFQDFPTMEDHPVTQLINSFSQSQGSVVMAYDEHQAIYHDQSNMGYWKHILPQVEEHELKYCYRMGEEISKVATNHRNIMLDWASRLIKTSQETPLSLEISPSYAFTGSRFYLIPHEGREVQFNVLSRYIKPLLNRYKPEEIAVIFFQTKDKKGKVHADSDQIDPLNNLEQLYRIRAMDALYAKGLEFRAGILVGPEPRFIPYKRILNEGKTLKNILLINDSLTWLLNHSGLVLIKEPNGRTLIKESGLQFILAFLTDPKKHSKELYEILLDGGFQSFFERFGETSRMPQSTQRNLRWDIQKSWHSLAAKCLLPNGNLEKTALNLHDYLKMRGRPQSKESRNENLHLVLSQLHMILERVDAYGRSKIQALFEGKLDKSLLSLNEFYVAITRFRETIIILNRQSEFDMFPILPGTKDYKDFELDFK